MTVTPATVGPLPDGSTLDATQVTVNTKSVKRQIAVIADPATGTDYANVTSAGALQTDASATTQPISATALPLPSGAATQTTLAAVLAALQAALTVAVDNFPATQPVSGTLGVAQGGNTANVEEGNADTISTTDYGLAAMARRVNFNDKTAVWERQRNNVEMTLLTSAARTTTTTTSQFVNYNGRALIITLDITVASGTGGLEPVLQIVDPVSGAVANMEGYPAAVTATGLYLYVYGWGGTTTAAGAIKETYPVGPPRTCQVQVAVADGSSYTYSLGAVLIN